MISKEKNCSVTCSINGKSVTLNTPPMTRLLDILRVNLKLTGTKEGCGEGECGACNVVVNDKVVNSCLVPVAALDGANILTIEGLNSPAATCLKKAFAVCNGAQCGICTPGMIVTASELLKRNSTPSLEVIKEELSGNLCRCTGYTKILEAVFVAGQELKSGKEA